MAGTTDSNFTDELDFETTWWEKIYYPCLRFYDYIVDIPKNIKWFIQRGKRGYSDSDLWSLDWYLCTWMPEALREMKRMAHGHPGSLKSVREWKQILEKIALGFEGQRHLQEMDYDIDNKVKTTKYQKDYEEGMELFTKWFRHLWD